MTSIDDTIHVLYVEEPQLAEFNADFLERIDDHISITTAKSASVALENLSGSEVDCIVSGYDLPGLNGIEFLEALREEDSGLPFILYTGNGNGKIASDAISAGATDYMQKGSGSEQYDRLAKRIQNAVDQYRTQRRDEQIERIRTVRSDITSALVRSESRSEAETRVCEIISGSEPYLFAWFGEMNSDANRLEPTAWGGIEGGNLDEISATADPNTGEHGPLSTAIRERRVVTLHRVQEDSEFEPWRQDALDRGYRSLAAIPLEYEDTFYGVLTIHSTRPDAFEKDEKDLIVELGTDISHAYHTLAVQTKLRRNTRAMDEAPIGITLSDPSQGDNPLVYLNRRFTELTGYDSEAVIGRNCRFLQGEETDPEPVARMAQAIDAEEPVSVELRNYRKDGSMFWNRVTVAAVENDDGEVTNYVGFQEDVTERREQEQALQKFHEAVERSSPAIYITDTDGTIEYVNPAFEEITGYSEAEAVGENPRILKSGEYDDEYYGEFWETILSGERWQHEIVDQRANNERVILDTSISPIVDEHGEPEKFVAVAQDTTARKEREEEITRLKERLELAVNGANLGVWDWDMTTDEVEFNEQWAAMLGYSLNEIEPDIQAWEKRVHPDDLTEVEAALEDHIADKTNYYETEHRMQTADGDWKWVRDVGRIVERDEQGDPVRAVGIHQDITDRREQELQLRQEKDRLNEFASVVSHDLRNPLNVAQGRIELAREECDTGHLDHVANGVERSLELIENLLDLARSGQEVSDLESVVLTDLVDTCWETVETADARFVVKDTPTILADNTRLRQLLENLFRNAVEHGSDSVTIRIGSLPDGFYIEDDGPGIPEEQQRNIWEAGYSGTAEGTGFGLSIVKQIVDAHGWNIRITEGSEDGARFEITGVEFAGK